MIKNERIANKFIKPAKYWIKQHLFKIRKLEIATNKKIELIISKGKLNLYL